VCEQIGREIAEDRKRYPGKIEAMEAWTEECLFPRLWSDPESREVLSGIV
jgi:hypothetical protein